MRAFRMTHAINALTRQPSAATLSRKRERESFGLMRRRCLALFQSF
jgi:hypothetical protein